MLSNRFQFRFLKPYLMLTVLTHHDLLNDEYHYETYIDSYVEVDHVEEVPTDFIASVWIWNVICKVEHHDTEQ